MKIKEGFLLKEVAGNNVIIPVGNNLVDFSAMITVNETGAFLWKLLAEDTDIDSLVKAMTAEFDVDEALAREDITEFINVLKDKKVLSE